MRLSWKMIGLPGVVLLAGCFSTEHIRLPSLTAQHPTVERRLYELHDPFPISQIGPDTQVRPRGFENQRSEPRRALQGYEALGTPPPAPQLGPPESAPPGPTFPQSRRKIYPQPNSGYPQAVRP